MNSSITPMPTRQHAATEADRRTAASAASHDAAAVAMATMTAGLKCSVYNAIAESRHGLVEEEVTQAFDLGDLTRAVLSALVQDGAVVEYQGVYILPRTAA